MNTKLITITLILIGAMFTVRAHATPTNVDRVVSVVGEMVITHSDTQLEAAIDAVMPSTTHPFSTPSLIERTEEMRLVLQVAIGVRSYQPTDSEIASRTAQMRMAWGDSWPAFVTQFGLDEITLHQLVRTRLTIERYVARNINGYSEAEWADWVDRRRAQTTVRRVAPQSIGDSTSDP